MTSLSLTQIYEKLLDHYGPQHWWPADSPFEVMVGAVLVQSTAWTNAAQAIDKLKAADSLSPQAIRALSVKELERLVRPSGFYRGKAKRLRALCEFLGQRFDDDIVNMAGQDTENLRAELLSVHGIGDETADDILLYALGHPIFVVDAFTRRVFHRLGLVEESVSYGDLQALFHNELPDDVQVFNEYHALIVAHANSSCRPTPACLTCPLYSDCPRIGV